MIPWLRRAPLLHVAVDTGGDGVPVVMLHGIGSSHVTFENVVPLIRGRHRVILLDLLGFGGSPAPEWARYTLAEHAASVARTVRSLQLPRRFVLVGHSMGALIAARYAARSRRPGRLILVSPPVYLTAAVIGEGVDAALMGLYPRVYDYLRHNKQFTIRAAAELARLSPIDGLLDVSEANWRAFMLSVENTIEKQTLLSDLAAVRVPTHIVYGTLDPFLAPPALRIVERFKGVTAHRIEGGDHLIRQRMAEVVAAAVG